MLPVSLTTLIFLLHYSPQEPVKNEDTHHQDSRMLAHFAPFAPQPHVFQSISRKLRFKDTLC